MANDRTDTLKKKFLDHLEKALGVVLTASMNSNIHRSTHYEWLKTDPEYKKQVEDIQNVALDFVESKLFNKIDRGDTIAIMFYLKCKGKERNWIEKQETKIETSGNFTIQYVEQQGNEPISDND